MIVVVRIAGQVGIRKDIKATIDRIRLRRKYACILLQEKQESLGMLKKLEAYVAYGKINESTLKELILKRAKLPGNKPLDTKKISDAAIMEIFSGKKKLSDLGVKPFLRLHPPRGGFKKSTKQFYPKGVLGNWNERINDLIKKML